MKDGAKKEGIIAVIAALVVLLSALLTPKVSTGIAVTALVFLLVYKFREK